MKKCDPSVARMAILGAVCLAFATAGCAGAPPRDDPAAVAAYNEANDPLEPLNRGIFEANLALDEAVLRPVAYVYKETVPDPVQSMIGNALHNLRTPVIFANDMLQGEFGRAGDTLVRFMMNSGLGILGALDIAAECGIPRHDEDFGQTAAVWGAGEGPYLMLPLLGPSNPRDALGKAVDFLFDPFTYLSYTVFNYSRSSAGVVDFRARRYDAIEDLKKTSLDYYAAVRSLYRQTRAREIRNGRPAQLRPLPTISFLRAREIGVQDPYDRKS